LNNILSTVVSRNPSAVLGHKDNGDSREELSVTIPNLFNLKLRSLKDMPLNHHNGESNTSFFHKSIIHSYTPSHRSIGRTSFAKVPVLPTEVFDVEGGKSLKKKEDSFNEKIDDCE
jgi:hypothetical protein